MINNKFKYLSLILILFFIDQYTKNYITNNIDKLIYKNFIFFKLDYVKNYGAAFNLFDGNRILLSFISIIISILLIYLIFIKKNKNHKENLGFSFILAGSLGNGIDRILNGYVIDYINLNFIDFAIFNIADISINLGVILLVYFMLKSQK